MIKDAIRRDEINQKFKENVLYFEIKVANITISYSCLIIRDIYNKSLTLLVVLILIKIK